MTPAFTPTIYPWLEAGGVYAVANLRGGGEYGSAWHEAGRLHRKQNVFDDFIAAAEFLVKERYTVPARLGIFGGSNGGLLVGAAMTQRPELFGAVVCSVPLLDMVRYHRFGSGRTWIGEYGSADNAADFKVLRAYSPYHQVKPGARYPALLMMSADHDDRVDPLHARKFVGALQAFGEGGPTWLRVETNAGHGGADQVAKLVEARADQYAFLMRQLAVRYRGKSMPVASPSSVNP
jgi:prolyl oligopeptidase